MNETPDGRLPEEQDDSGDLIPFSPEDEDLDLGDGGPGPATDAAPDPAPPGTAPAHEPVQEPASESVRERASGPVHERASESASEPAYQRASEPVHEPASKSDDDGVSGVAGDGSAGDGPVGAVSAARRGDVSGPAPATGDAVGTRGSQGDATAPADLGEGPASGGESSHSLGDGSVSGGETSHGVGEGSVSGGESSHGLGEGSGSGGETSHDLGDGAVAGDGPVPAGAGEGPESVEVSEGHAAEGQAAGVGTAGHEGERAVPGDQGGRAAAGAGKGGRPSGRRKAARKAGLVAAGLAVALIGAGVGVIVLVKPYLSPADFEGRGEGTVTVRIPPGASAQAIGTALADAGVVASAQAFVRASEDRAVTGRLRPGTYRLRKGMASTAALDLLLDAASRVVKRVTVPEGMRVSEVLTRLAKQTGLSLKEFLAVDKGLVGLPSYAPGLEGFLFPATYEIEPGDTPVDVLAAMVERFGVEARRLRLAEQAARVHLTPLEAVTVASMIQAEGGTDADYPKIARVIYNRLERGTPLEIDSTVLYAQKRRTLRVTEKDTKVDSPYNTYRRKGLPPGPIANPGAKALVAALNPADGDWHWFVTTDPAHRITKFTNKESEFVRYREELNKNLGTS
ncbi:endolytic transglycosylase MltG [Nonomuraea wenchangensis]|uniref:endolytic transglycosylase MltG n=1 Tax=Nonomuraea wenchangensis TaxID=568860 RepID=UPI00332B2857